MREVCQKGASLPGNEVLSLPGGSENLVTSTQTYTFTCTVCTDVTSTTLESVPASRE